VSLASNIAEGFERGGNRELRQLLAIARGSAGELRAQFYLALDAELLSQQQFDRLSAGAVETSETIAGFLRYLARSEFKGSKFREDRPLYEVDEDADAS
jgi:four helix bundle protein